MAYLTFRDSGPASGLHEYPNRPIKVIVPFGAGGSSDTFVRVIQKAITDGGMFDQPVVIINQGGGSGTIGSRTVKDAEPDGYTLLNLHEAMMTAQASGKVVYGPESFEPIAATGRSSLVVLVRSDSKVRDLRHLLQEARERPDTLGFGTNIGSPSHFAGLLLERTHVGARFRYIQTGGGQKRYTSLIGGHIEVGVFSLDEYINYSGDGKIRALALLNAEPDASTPDIPTARQQGVDVVYSNTQYWWAPKGTPPERIETIAGVLERAMATPYVRDRLSKMHIDPIVVQGKSLRHQLAERSAMLRRVNIPESTDLPDFPAYVLVILALLGVWVVVESLRQKPAKEENSPTEGQPVPNRPRLAVAIAAITIAYVCMLQLRWIRFSLLTLLFILLASFTLGQRHRRQWLGLAEVAYLCGLGLEYVFTRLLVIDLP